MRKLVLIWVTVGLCVSVCAQTGKKMRHTASNTKEAVTERQISSRFNSGLRAYYTAQYEEALQTFSGILSDAPKHAPSYYMLARVYGGRQQYTEAESALKQAVKLDKNNIWYQVALAESYITTENYKSALPMWEKICKQMPHNPDCLTSLAVCYEKTGASDKAAVVRAQLSQLSQNKKDTQDSPQKPASASASSDHKTLGLGSLESKQYEQAVQHLELALREDDTDYDLWSAFATAVAQSGQWSKLTDKEEDLTTLFPQSATLLCALATAFLHTSNPEKAVEYYKQARAFSFDSAQIQEIKKGLFEAYTALGDTENADRYR